MTGSYNGLSEGDKRELLGHLAMSFINPGKQVYALENGTPFIPAQVIIEWSPELRAWIKNADCWRPAPPHLDGYIFVGYEDNGS